MSLSHKMHAKIILLATLMLGMMYFEASAFKLDNTLKMKSKLRSFSKPQSSALNSVWGNYSSDGKKESKFLLFAALLLVAKVNFMSINIRTTYICPSGPGSDKVLQSLIEQEPGFKCLSFGELATKMLTAPLVFPGDPEYDPEFLRISMIGMNKK
mmetsp:Transcript_23129/g.33156  ORF Transcript_23129/g.33156 Transcript_23129/m.33156 type:complete len:155 (+) Transcript_23129:28-492(+)